MSKDTINSKWMTIESPDKESGALENHAKEIARSDKRDAYLKKLAEGISLSAPESIRKFGELVQQSSNDFSTQVLETVKSKDLGEVGDDMKNLVKTIRMNDTSKMLPLGRNGQLAKPNFFSRIFQKARESTFEIRVRMTHVETQIEEVAATLKQKSKERVEDNHHLEDMHNKNLDLATQLTDYIDAGNLKIADLEKNDLPKLTAEVQALKTTSPEYQRKSNELQDLKDNKERLEHRIHDLYLNRQLLMQSGPQIRMLQKSNNELVEQTDSLLSIAIPAWKNQAALTIQILKSADQANLDSEVRQMTNASIVKSAKLLNQASVQIAHQSSQSVIDVGALKASQEQLIDSIDKITAISKNTAQMRLDEKKAIAQMTKEMRDHLLNNVHDTMKDITPEQAKISYKKDFDVYDH